MTVTIRRPSWSIVLHVKRVGLDPSLLIVESDSLTYETQLTPGSLEMEVRVSERAALVASGRFRLNLPEDSTLLVRTSEQRVEIEAVGGSGKLAVLDGMAWIEAI